ncbi:hypothetical protein [Sulfobacillus sp. hq2]|uniref:hypothetical protein n=1 Tax=Sulfobacillus TaxID=28033 RepID=UPI000CD14B09|nr:hypothetical protein [Sulfobacillus sp. hq2]POB10115.1 hypothetical protein CO251_11565 [Sulfobacillus sp. hq2]
MATATETKNTALTVWAKLPAGYEFPEQDLRPERYRIKARGFEGPVDTVTNMTGVILAVREARWMPFIELDGKGNEIERDPVPTQCQLVERGVGEWHTAPLDIDGPVERRECASCPMNRWGTAANGGKGKACREKRLLLVLRDGEALPVVVVAPPTSLLSVGQFETRAAARRLRLGQIHVKLSTSYQKSGQMEWGVLSIEELEILDAAAQAALVERLMDGPLHDFYTAWTQPPVQQDQTF